MHDAGSVKDVTQAQEWLDGYLVEAEQILSTATEAGWNFFTNVTKHNNKRLADSEEVHA